MKQSVCVHVRNLEVLSTNGRAPIGPIVVTQRVTTSGPMPSHDNQPTQRKSQFESRHPAPHGEQAKVLKTLAARRRREECRTVWVRGLGWERLPRGLRRRRNRGDSFSPPSVPAAEMMSACWRAAIQRIETRVRTPHSDRPNRPEAHSMPCRLRRLLVPHTRAPIRCSKSQKSRV